jgi:hypothetical protein
MSARKGNVTDFPADRIIDPSLAAVQRAKALPKTERRFPALPGATRQAIMFLVVAKEACMSERRGSRQRAAGMIDLAIKELKDAVATGKAVAREDLGKAMIEALGQDVTGNDGIAAVQDMLSVLYYALDNGTDTDDDSAA